MSTAIFGPVRRAALKARSRLGRLRRWLRARVEGTLHPRRRRRARRRVHALGHPRQVLFVCLGNVCRSPYAEARFRALFGHDPQAPEVASAGFMGPNRPPPDRALAATGRRGLDTSEHRSRLLTPEMLVGADIVVVMEASQRRQAARILRGSGVPMIVLGDFDPDAVQRRSIPDPWDRDPEAFDDVFERIDRCVRALVEEIRRSPNEPRTTDSDTTVGAASLDTGPIG